MMDLREDYRDKERKKAMIKKTLSITLTVLFILPAICFAQDVKVEDIKFRWRKTLGTSRYFLTQIPILNRTDERCNIRGKFLFLDKDGFKLNSVPFCESVEARESKILYVRGAVSRDDYEDTATFKASMEISSFKRTYEGKSPLKIDKTLTLPPWD